MDQFLELQNRYPSFSISIGTNGCLELRGTISVDVSMDAGQVTGEYLLTISVPPDYPTHLPTATEVGGKIPKGFHRFAKDQSLCLAAPVEQKRIFRCNPTLIGFVDNLVVSYLLNFSCWYLHGSLPFGELSHGAAGLYEYYAGRFQTDQHATLLLLRSLADNSKDDPLYCPCGSHKTAASCHGDKLSELASLQTNREFNLELNAILDHLIAERKVASRSIYYTAADRIHRARLLKRKAR